MENYFSKMKEYLQMDTEIPFGEFVEYYDGVMGYLQKKYEGLEKEQLLQTKLIMTVLASNSSMRAQRKGPEAKKYKKMAQKSNFWSEAVNFKLTTSGVTQQAIDSYIEEQFAEN